MSNVTLLLFVVGLALGAVTATSIIFPLLKKKGVKTEEILKKADAGLNTADAIIGVADKILPNNPAVSIMKLIDSAAHKGVTQAEQLYIASQLPAEDRYIKAKETISAVLKLAKIEETPELDKIIDGAIQSEVLALGHKSEDVKAQQATQAQLQQVNTKLQTENETLKQQNTQLSGENDQLKQTISNVQAAAQTVQSSTGTPVAQ